MGIEENPIDYGIPDYEEMAHKAMRICKAEAIQHISGMLNCSKFRAEIIALAIAAGWECCEDAAYKAAEEFDLSDEDLFALLGNFDKFSTLYFKIKELEND